ncbi:hypothetical protein C8A05DRAFT_34678 [Staphylotrichum tortipilum]|uniref:Uncharacterized protein n=1 Tax=Staphylotrichum tortipilum TaxID=2831512 RepID=A0AAN6MIR3_9PEZI|nr:hypothetical protein C8A05DRAFT_34678 [Staphylotrichum longicolle]
MPELLLQSALAASKTKQLVAEAARIKATCRAQHREPNDSQKHDGKVEGDGDNKSLVLCPPCYEGLLEALRARFLGSNVQPPPPDQPQTDQDQDPAQPQPPPAQPEEWFTQRHTFLSALEALLVSAKEYQVSPQAIDDRVREEQSRWYAERVRSALLRLLVEDPSGREAVFEKLEDMSAESDPVALAREVAEILRGGPLAVEEGTPATDLPEKLAAAEGEQEKMDVLQEAFFRDRDGAVPEDHQRYLVLLREQGLSMEQIVDRILEDRQTAIGAREQTAKLNQRLEELRRARAAHEAQKSRKAQRRESLAQQEVPDELYELPACTVCGGTPNSTDFFCCSICTILAGTGVQERQTIFCSKVCEEKGYAAHTKTHICSAAWDCTRAQQNPQPSSTATPPPPPPTATTSTTSPTGDANDTKPGGDDDEDTPMADAPPAPAPPVPPSPSGMLFCTECLTTLKQPTLWCSRACTEANFHSHREGVHLPERQKLELDVDDAAQLEYYSEDGKEEEENVEKGEDEEEGASGEAKRKLYRAKDIGALTTSLEEAVKGWEGKYRVQLHNAD